MVNGYWYPLDPTMPTNNTESRLNVAEQCYEVYFLPNEHAPNTPLPDPIGFRMSLIGDLFDIYSSVTASAFANTAVSHAVWMLDASFWNEPWIPAATQAALNALGSAFPFNQEQKDRVNSKLAEYGIQCALP